MATKTPKKPSAAESRLAKAAGATLVSLRETAAGAGVDVTQPPPPRQPNPRTVRAVVTFYEAERARIQEVAERRGEPFAAAVRSMAIYGAEIFLAAQAKRPK